MCPRFSAGLPHSDIAVDKKHDGEGVGRALLEYA
ncbi:GNAT family N-acetyltransferase [Dokdonella sp.]